MYTDTTVLDLDAAEYINVAAANAGNVTRMRRILWSKVDFC